MNIERPEIIQVLRHAHDEVVTLRRRIAELEPKAMAYDTIAQIAALSIHPSNQGYSVDVAWRLKEIVEKLVAERNAERADQPEPTCPAHRQPVSRCPASCDRGEAL